MVNTKPTDATFLVVPSIIYDFIHQIVQFFFFQFQVFVGWVKYFVRNPPETNSLSISGGKKWNLPDCFAV